MRATTHWQVYIVRCADGTLYTGVAINVERRVNEHNGVRANGASAVRKAGASAVRKAGARAVRETGARYTRSRRPVKLVYHEHAANRSAACKREYRIKQLTRREKLTLIAAGASIFSPATKK